MKTTPIYALDFLLKRTIDFAAIYLPRLSFKHFRAWMATSDVRDILDLGVGDQGRAGQPLDPAKPTKESIMNPLKVNLTWYASCECVYL